MPVLSHAAEEILFISVAVPLTAGGCGCFEGTPPPSAIAELLALGFVELVQDVEPMLQPTAAGVTYLEAVQAALAKTGELDAER